MILSAVSVWKKFNTSSPLKTSEWGEEKVGNTTYLRVTFSGHATPDGAVRIYADFAKPNLTGKIPAILFLGDAGKTTDREILDYFTQRGYAVLCPDYTGKSVKDPENTPRTVYPPSLSFANYDVARGLDELGELSPKSPVGLNGPTSRCMRSNT
jgi:cephalosporin-C deacetylase-like acetyl esterase